MKSLVFAEKPSVGKDIARVLGCRGGANGYLEGPQHVVTWGFGHLVTLADPEGYDKAYKQWDINALPIMPNDLKLMVIPQTAKQYNTVKTLMHRKDISDIIIATDAGREGELVARWTIEKAQCKKLIKRLWISSVTDKAIKNGFKNLKDGKLYVGLGESAKARAEADWLVGINATRCLTTKYNAPLSCGRVQTPTLSIVAKREQEIRSFVPVPFWGIGADAGNFKLNWMGLDGNTRSFDKQKIDSIYNKIKGTSTGTVADVSKTHKKKYAPPLYDLTELQRDANKRFNFSPKETLSIMQALYEEHKCLTYPRTDSRYLSSDIIPTLKDRLKAVHFGAYQDAVAPLLKEPTKSSYGFVDNNKVSDHHAIIPTEERVDIRALNDRERRIYDLVVKRFIAVFYPAFEYEQVKFKVRIGEELFTAGGMVIVNDGYRKVEMSYDDDEEDNQKLPALKKGDKLSIKSLRLTEGKTSPPSPFNEATLLSAMENPAKHMDSKNSALAETLKNTGGLGTVATRADIIEKLFDGFVIEKRGKDIFTTSKGRQLLELVPPELKSPELTGQWEQKMQSIQTGKLNRTAFIKDIRSYTSKIIKDIKDSTAIYKHDNLSSTKCPNCGLMMLQVMGKKGEMLVCQDRECNERINISMSIRSKCPNCYKWLKVVGEGDKRTIECSCGYKEKYAQFTERKKNTMSKKDIQQYLNTQEKKNEAPANNPFAALRGKF